MVEDVPYVNNKPKSKTTRPRPAYLWTVTDVQKWLRRCCSEYFDHYSECFLKHDITGRALVRFNDNTLIRLGVLNPEHRMAIWKEILKVKLKIAIMEIKELEGKNNFTSYDLQTIPV